MALIEIVWYSLWGGDLSKVTANELILIEIIQQLLIVGLLTISSQPNEAILDEVDAGDTPDHRTGPAHVAGPPQFVRNLMYVPCIITFRIELSHPDFTMVDYSQFCAEDRRLAGTAGSYV